MINETDSSHSESSELTNAENQPGKESMPDETEAEGTEVEDENKQSEDCEKKENQDYEKKENDDCEKKENEDCETKENVDCEKKTIIYL